MYISPWSTERTNQLKEWWDQGLSSTIIRDLFKEKGYEVTKNAVIGKVHRLKMKPPSNKKQHRTPVRNIHHSRNIKAANVRAEAINRLIHSSPEPTRPTIRFRRMNIVVPPKPSKQEVREMNGAPRLNKRVLLRKTEEHHCRAIIGYANGILADAICCGEEAPWIINGNGKLTRSPWCQYHRDRYINFDARGKK